MAARFARYPGAVERTVELADELAFPLRRARPALPKQEVPPGHTPMSYLRELVWNAVPDKYPHLTPEQRVRIEKLDMEVEFAAGELIHTENSYKYDMDGICGLAAQTGFELSRTWLDSQERFSSNLLLAN